MKSLNTVRFGSGRLVIVDATGAMPVAELTDVSVDFGATDKQLPSGDLMVPVFSIRTDLKASVKAKIQRALSSRLMAVLNSGTLTTTGVKKVIERESHTAGASITVTDGTKFVSDLGVLDGNSNAMQPVASAPQLGEYVAGGVGVGTYTFNAGQTGNVLISYVETVASGGELVTVAQQNVGQSPTVQGYFYSKAAQPDGTVSNRLFIFAALVPSKISEAAKRGDFANADVEFEALASSTGAYYEVHNAP
jgi:hypothetical protein